MSFRTFGGGVVSLNALAAFPGTALGQTFEPVTLGPLANARLELPALTGYLAPLPTSDPLVLAGIPFDHPQTNWAWNAHLAAAGGSSVALMIPLANRPAVRVYTQLNTYWGIPGPTVLAAIRFHFADGSFQQHNLVGNFNIRDYNQAGWTNSLPAPNATVGITWLGGNQRMDVQAWLVNSTPEAPLVGIEFLDWGAYNYNRIILGGVTLDLGPDADWDGIADIEDNCDSQPNPLQGDCDSDGTGDACEIADGSPDVNGNGVPDTCDCPADINQSGTIDAEDLAYVLFAWGMTGGKAGGADINGDATVDANDLSLVLGSWGPCPG